MKLTGLQDYIPCHTNKLDHAGVEDYTSRGDFFTVNDDKEDDGWGGCYEVSKTLSAIFIVTSHTSHFFIEELDIEVNTNLFLFSERAEGQGQGR